MYDYETWEIFCTADEIARLEETENMVLSDEALVQAYFNAKDNRALRLFYNAQKRNKERVKTKSWQRTADSYKRTLRKGYDLKVKGQTRKDCQIVPPDALGWDKLNMNIMGTKTHGVKTGYIFDVT